MRSNHVSVIRSPAIYFSHQSGIEKHLFPHLSLTLLFSAGHNKLLRLISNAPPIGIIGLASRDVWSFISLTVWLRNSAWGLLAIFAYTGFLGYTLGPILKFLHFHHFTNGPQLIGTALGATGVIFLGLSAYALTSRKTLWLSGEDLSLLLLSLLSLLALAH